MRRAALTAEAGARGRVVAEQVFSGATDAMSWLANLSSRISKDINKPIVWVTPLGWPVLQPYFQVKRRRVRTPFNTMTVLEQDQLDLLDDNSKAPVLKSKQRSALPPNYVHSLDSTHMLLTATRCAEDGLVFAAVRDGVTHTHAMPNSQCAQRSVRHWSRSVVRAIHRCTTRSGRTRATCRT